MSKGYATQDELNRLSSYERIRRAWRATHRQVGYVPFSEAELVERWKFTPISAKLFSGAADALEDVKKGRHRT